MRYIFHLLLILIICSGTIAEAQTDLIIKRRQFKGEKSGFRDAWKHVKEGDKFYLMRGAWYSNAYAEFVRAVAYNSSNPELNYKTGISALYSDKKEDAAGYLLKAYEEKNDVSYDILLVTGRALQYAGKYTEAIQKLESYLNSKERKSKANIALAKKCIEECRSAEIITSNTLFVDIVNLGTNINSSANDFSEVVSEDGTQMYFASDRQLPGSNNKNKTGKYDENIYVSKKAENSWGNAIIGEKNIVTKFSEAPLFISPVNDMLYLYSGYENGGDIKVSQNKKGKWRSPGSVKYRINTKGSETSFCFTPDGNQIYFVTDNKKNNLGGKDIFYITKLTDRKWSKPLNAGPLVNTKYDEESIAFSKGGDTLWFSSKGHNTIGGFDVFYSVRNKLGGWDSARNCGYPINTPWEELFYKPDLSDNKAFYIVTNRGAGQGGLDIYHGKIVPPPPIPVVELEPPPSQAKHDTIVSSYTIDVHQEVEQLARVEVVQETPTAKSVYLAGKVKDSETGDPVMAKLDVLDITSGQVLMTTASSDVDGSYRVMLPEKKSYKIDIRATGFLPDIKRIDIPLTWPNEVYNFSFDMIKVKVGKKVVLNNILFETGKTVLTAGSYSEIDKLYNIMKENGQMKIEISGHTDKTGSEPINLKLSADRAKAVKDLLVKKGIEDARMTYKGFGSSQPIGDNATAPGRAKNRRVEFKILEF